jgi:prophage tail gpP-like protein
MPTLAPATTTFVSDEIGDQEDRVAIQLNGDDLIYCQSWNLEESILEQPARWSVRMGFGDVAVDLYWAYPPNTPFQISIYEKPQLTGFLDGRRLRQQGNAGTELIVSGRDALAEIQGAKITTAQSFAGTSYQGMVQRVLEAVGLDPNKLGTNNDANRQSKVGASVPAGTPFAITDIVNATANDLQTRPGENWLEFLRRHLDRAGLFLWSAGDGTFVLGTPNFNQPPSYRLARTATQDSGQTNILGHELNDDTTNRYSSYGILARGGGRKHGRVKAVDNFIDHEMQDDPPGGYGFDRPYYLVDHHSQSTEQVQYMARRKCAEDRRKGWFLEYSFAGHTLPYADGNGSQRAVVIPDTTIDVQDDFLRISGTFYVETVKRRRDPGTITTIRLMRGEDLVFGEVKAKGTKSGPAATPAQQQAAGTGLLNEVISTVFGQGVFPLPGSPAEVQDPGPRFPGVKP